MSTLMLHCGAQEATRKMVDEVFTPASTKSHVPVPHGELLALIAGEIENQGFRVTNESYGLQDGKLRHGDEDPVLVESAKMFGLLDIANGTQAEDYTLSLGIRNAHDKSLTAACAIGTNVFVCDNLAFSADMTFAKKHTVNILRDLPGLIAGAFQGIHAARIKQEVRIDVYKNCQVNDRMAHDIIIRAMQAGVIASSHVGFVADQWHAPIHEDFKPRNLWSLQNAFTEVTKKQNIFRIPKATMNLYGVMDEHSGVREELIAETQRELISL